MNCAVIDVVNESSDSIQTENKNEAWCYEYYQQDIRDHEFS
jgi:hypothetical protein